MKIFKFRSLATALRMRHLLMPAAMLLSFSVYAEQDHHDGETRHIELSETALKYAQLTTAIASPGQVQQNTKLYGKILLEPTAVSHIRARYPGVVQSVEVHIGDRVERGQLLARVHSNESLQDYPLRAPFSGTVTAKHAGPGEYVSDQVLFTVTDYSSLWAELQVFPANLSRVQEGQGVRITAGEQKYAGTLRSIVPAGNDSPYSRARVRIDNGDGRWVPGVFVAAQVQMPARPEALVVDSRALQQVDGETVVFVRMAPGRFEVRDVMTGERGEKFTAVLRGLTRGENYVVANSYLLKAELEKSAAEHAH
ncbi:efflux RND transporter periplasmic adaptor subunit [Microbulbifer aggregans]|uniref:efflux RND transporter periplasmic adaptor subunit n=1 Tax=Microbulbifer aggregans TaxID=1769779 RepID=UPI001CFC69AC|nr:efflux RND transporter periplasmic adaptor subunit [Microbulbifer aggregans]